MTIAERPDPLRIDPDTVYLTHEIAERLRVTAKTVAESAIPCSMLGYRTRRYLGAKVLAYLAETSR